MELFFYCSYNLSANGYTLSKADLSQEELIAITRDNISEIPAIIRNIFTHGGADIVCGKDSTSDYLIIKGIKNENKEKSVDDQGRTVFINIAFYGSTKEIKKLCLYIAGRYEEFVSTLGPLIYPASNEVGYDIAYTEIKRFLGQFTHQDVALVPRVPSNTLTKALKAVTDATSFYFIVLQDTKQHFCDLCKLPPKNISSAICVPKAEFQMISADGVLLTELVSSAPPIPPVTPTPPTPPKPPAPPPAPPVYPPAVMGGSDGPKDPEPNQSIFHSKYFGIFCFIAGASVVGGIFLIWNLLI